MAKDLERDLGLWSVLAISIGAMVGSGIFILPALAMKMAGPAVVLAYLLAGLLVLPAALSKSEMATAMPEAGGTYVYIERGMGPMLGTIAGIGTWFSLSFKGALALIGGAPYIILLFDLPVTPVALGIATLLIVVNLVGAKQTGRLQVLIVTVMLAAMAWFLAGSGGAVQQSSFSGTFDDGIGGLLAATGFVYVSYAGVTKVASVAEEIENPDRVIPIGMLGSLAFTTLLYVLVVTVIVGAAPGDVTGSNTPVADVAEATMAEVGVVAVVLAAILALISTANAGLLSSSRYPFAMSRDDLAPPSLSRVSDRFDTPTTAITLTGAVMLVLIAFVPIDDIAKLGSAFKIIVFVLVNVALVAFRESDVEDYDPSFRDPLYPFSQAFGIVGGLVLLTFMGPVPLVGAVVFVLAGLLWYLVYARKRVRRDGVARDELRRRVGERAVEETRSAVDEAAGGHAVVVGVTEATEPATEATLVRIGGAIAEARGSTVDVVRFDSVPDQLPLGSAAETKSRGDREFEARMAALDEEIGAPMAYGEIVSHDVRHAVVNYADHHDADLIVLEDGEGGVGSVLFDDDDEWVAGHAPCDVLVVNDVAPVAPSRIALVTDSGPFDPFKVEIANALAAEVGASLQLFHGLGDRGTGEQRATIEAYHDELRDLVSVPVESRLVEGTADVVVEEAVASADVVVVEGDSPGIGRLVGRSDGAARLDAPSIELRPHRERTRGLLGRIIQRVTF